MLTGSVKKAFFEWLHISQYGNINFGSHYVNVGEHMIEFERLPESFQIALQIEFLQTFEYEGKLIFLLILKIMINTPILELSGNSIMNFAIVRTDLFINQEFPEDIILSVNKP